MSTLAGEDVRWLVAFAALFVDRTISLEVPLLQQGEFVTQGYPHGRIRYDFQTFDSNLPCRFRPLHPRRADVEIRAILDPEIPRVETRLTDSLIRVWIDGEEVLVHTEFQTTDSRDTPMPIRMASYIIRLIEYYGLPVYSHVSLPPARCRATR